MKAISRDVFIPYSRFGVTGWPGFVSYIHRKKPILMHRYGLQEGDDVYGTWSDIISYDNGRTWTPERIIQRDPEGNAFNNHYCAMNGFFRQISEHQYEYIFGFFGHAYKPKLQRMLRLGLKIG